MPHEKNIIIAEAIKTIGKLPVQQRQVAAVHVASISSDKAGVLSP